MKFNRKLLTRAVVGAAAVALVAPLAACSSGSSGGTNGGTVPISWWTWDANQAISYQKCATQFNKDNPGIHVTVSNYGWNDYWTKITAGFVAGNGPDTFMDHTTYYPQFASKHELAPLGKYVKSSNIKLSDYGPAVKQFTYKDGQLYAIPNDTATEVYYYNEADVKAAGLTDQDMQNMTWNPDDGGTFGKIVAKLTVDTKGVRGDQPGFDKNSIATYGLGPQDMSGNNGQDTWSGIAGSTGWTLGNKQNYPTQYQYSQPVFKKSLDWLRNLETEGFVPKPGVFTNAVQDQIGSGKIAMLGSPTSNLVSMSTIKGVKVGIAPTVTGPKGRSTLVNSNSDSMSATTKHPEQAWKWMQYLTGEKCQSLAGADASFIPILPKAQQATYASLEKQGIDTTVLKKIYADDKFFYSPVSLGGTQMDNALSPMWSDYFSFQSGDEIFDKMTQTSKQILAQANGN